MPKKSKAYWLYMVRCRDRSLYTGISIDVKARVARHNTGHGAKYTASRRPVRLVYSEKVGSLSLAMRREHEVKRMSKARKTTLIGSQKKAHRTLRRSSLRS